MPRLQFYLTSKSISNRFGIELGIGKRSEQLLKISFQQIRQRARFAILFGKPGCSFGIYPDRAPFGIPAPARPPGLPRARAILSRPPSSLLACSLLLAAASPLCAPCEAAPPCVHGRARLRLHAPTAHRRKGSRAGFSSAELPVSQPWPPHHCSLTLTQTPRHGEPQKTRNGVPATCSSL